jgi:hypothetical protein
LRGALKLRADGRMSRADAAGLRALMDAEQKEAEQNQT